MCMGESFMIQSITCIQNIDMMNFHFIQTFKIICACFCTSARQPDKLELFRVTTTYKLNTNIHRRKKKKQQNIICFELESSYKNEFTKGNFSSCYTKLYVTLKMTMLNMSLASVMTKTACVSAICFEENLMQKPQTMHVQSVIWPDSQRVCFYASALAYVHQFLRVKKRRSREKTTVQMRGKESKDGK